MGNKHCSELRVYKRVRKLILAGLPNMEILQLIRQEFPQHRTSPEQIRFERSDMRRGDDGVLSSVEARHRRKVAHQSTAKNTNGDSRG